MIKDVDGRILLDQLYPTMPVQLVFLKDDVAYAQYNFRIQWERISKHY
jgi:hypothetical protein